ncbi:MAG: DUF63 family protein [Halodesulfurarchaeum sp.]
MVLPAGTTLPPLPHTLVLLATASVVAWALYRQGVSLDARIVLALSPWMVAGASLYALYQLSVPPDVIAPFLSSPAVYLTTFTVAGAVWAVGRYLARTANGGQDPDRAREGGRPEALGSSSVSDGWPSPVLGLAGAGVGAMLALLGIALAVGLSRGTLSLTWPVIGAVIGLGVGWVGWRLLGRFRPEPVETLGPVGLLAVVGHALDGVSTAVGVDVFNYGEQTPLSRLVMETAGALPTAPVLGVGWLFVLVKVLVALLVVWLLAGYVREEPTHGHVLLTVVIAVGLGPGAHNLVLFAVAGPAGI